MTQSVRVSAVLLLYPMHDLWLAPAACQLADRHWGRSDRLHFCSEPFLIHNIWPQHSVGGFWRSKISFLFVMTWVGRSIIARTREAPQWLSQLCGGAGPSLFDESAQRRNSNFSLNWFDVFKLWFHFLDGCRNMLRQRWKMAEESFCSSWSSPILTWVSGLVKLTSHAPALPAYPTHFPIFSSMKWQLFTIK